MAYQSSVWLGSIAALCPSQDTAGDGTTTLTDFTGVSNGVLTSMDAATDWVTDDGKRCLDFDGVNDYVVTTATPIGIAQRVSMSFYARRVANTGFGVCLGVAPASNSPSHQLIFYHYTDGNVYVHVGGLNYGFFAWALTDQAWRSVVINFDGTATGNANRLKVWMDGAAKTITFSGTIPAAIISADSRVFLGASPYSPSPNYGAFRLDDFRLRLRVMSDAERAEIDVSRGGTYAAASGGIPIARGMHGGMR